MENTIVVSPGCTADSALDLANKLEVEHVSIESFTEDHLHWENHKIINWGCSKIPHTPASQVILNKPGAVRRTLNKITAFNLLSEHVRMPMMTTEESVAIEWAYLNRKVVCRELVKSCKSKGITITSSPEIIQSIPAKFYTRFIGNCDEYRINVYKGKVLTVYYKLPSNGDFLFKIRLDEESTWQAKVQDMIDAVHEHVKLDMFGLDVLVSPKGKHFLLEVNSAPILFPITTRRLAKAIKGDYNG